MDKEDHFPFFIHEVGKPLRRLPRRRLIVRRYARHQPLIIAPRIECHDRDIAFRSKVELDLACLRVCDRDRHRLRISCKLFVQDIHLLVHIIRRRGRAVGQLDTGFPFVSQVLIHILHRLLGAFLYFIPVRNVLRLADHRQRGSFLKI